MIDPTATPDNAPRQCTANSQRTGKRCERPADPGKSVCYYHGSTAGRPPSTGEHCPATELTVAQRVKNLLDSGQLEERLTAALGAAVIAFESTLNDSSLTPEQVESITRQGARLYNIKLQIEEGRRRAALTTADIALVMAHISTLTEFVPEPRRKAFLTKLRQFSGVYQPDGVARLELPPVHNELDAVCETTRQDDQEGASAIDSVSVVGSCVEPAEGPC